MKDTFEDLDKIISQLNLAAILHQPQCMSSEHPNEMCGCEVAQLLNLYKDHITASYISRKEPAQLREKIEKMRKKVDKNYSTDEQRYP